MFCVTDRIKVLGTFGRFDLLGEIGTIIFISKNINRKNILVEFDGYIRGHGGGSYGYTCGVKGKDGYCWWMYKTEIEHIEEQNYNIKEKINLMCNDLYH